MSRAGDHVIFCNRKSERRNIIIVNRIVNCKIIFVFRLYYNLKCIEILTFCIIFAGSPEVTLHKVPSVFINEYVKLKATIRGFPKNYRVTWMKSGQHINTTDPKYTGSMVNGDISVLCIRNLENDDNGVYTVRVQNTYGIGQSTEELEVIGGNNNHFLQKI